MHNIRKVQLRMLYCNCSSRSEGAPIGNPGHNISPREDLATDLAAGHRYYMRWRLTCQDGVQRVRGPLCRPVLDVQHLVDDQTTAPPPASVVLPGRPPQRFGHQPLSVRHEPAHHVAFRSLPPAVGRLVHPSRHQQGRGRVTRRTCTHCRNPRSYII